MDNQPASQKKSLLFFLKWGVLELCFVGFVIFLLFATLNYFGILSLTKTFPLLLSQTKSKQFSSPTSSEYDPIKAQKSLVTYMKNILVAKYLPAGLESILPTENGASFTYLWQIGSPNAPIQATTTLIFQQHTNTTQMLINSIQLPISASINSANPTAFQKILQQYYKKDFSLQKSPFWHCTKNSKFCETLVNDFQGKIFYGLTVSKNTTAFSRLFSCFFPKESQLFSTAATCLPYL